MTTDKLPALPRWTYGDLPDDYRAEYDMCYYLAPKGEWVKYADAKRIIDLLMEQINGKYEI